MCLALLCCTCMHAQHRIMVFANGYLGPDKDKIPRNNGATFKAQSYWYAYDDTILNRFKRDVPVYISGHHPMSTSTHRTKLRFGLSWIGSKLIWFRSKKGVFLNKRYNPEGFLTRFNNGKICAKHFLELVRDSLGTVSKLDTIDIVCHSMGYAYVLGLLSQVDSLFTLGKMLIIAPESPGFMGYDWNQFAQVWQYGSNLGSEKPDILCFQDGIAPQGPVKDIEKLKPGKGGRVYLPRSYDFMGKKTKTARGTVWSHHLSKFQWFYGIRPGDYGYFAP